jgi:hypothetical protein
MNGRSAAGTAIFGCDRNHSLTDTVERHYLIRFEENCNSCTSRRKIILIRKKTKDLEKRNEQLEKELAHSRRYAIHYRRHGRL